jgi:hypothetical protein
LHDVSYDCHLPPTHDAPPAPQDPAYEQFSPSDEQGWPSGGCGLGHSAGLPLDEPPEEDPPLDEPPLDEPPLDPSVVVSM